MEANKILKGMMTSTNKYCRRRLAKVLSVDIQTCEPVLNPVYDKSMKNNLFIFLNQKNSILGFLKGCEIQDHLNKSFAIYSDYPKNRKHLSQHAANVLMITPSMRKLTIKEKVITNPLYVRDKARIELKERLREYKANKYRELTHENMIDIIHNIIGKLNDNLFNDELVNKLSPVISGFDDSILKALRTFSELSYDYIRYEKEFQREYKSRREYSPEIKPENLYYYKELIKLKNEIITWDNILKEA